MPASPPSFTNASSGLPQPVGWLGVAIGNSYLHWGWFDPELAFTWNTSHLSPWQVEQLLESCFDFRQLGIETVIDTRRDAVENQFQQEKLPQLAFQQAFQQVWQTVIAFTSQLLPLWVASVVPNQTKLWQQYAGTRVLTLAEIPLYQTYATLGLDRALAVWGAWHLYKSPVLVIDAGTALTLTGASSQGTFSGGAILPGLGLQIQALGHKTASLPSIQSDFVQLTPPRWGTNTNDAIRSGVFYTTVAGVKDFIQAWWQDFPQSHVVVTGGDGYLIYPELRTSFPQKANTLHYLPHLVLRALGWLVKSY
jgi:type III pantothenate kinase